MTADELRKKLSAEDPKLFSWMDTMKEQFGAKVLYVETPTINVGKEPTEGVKPYATLPDSTWHYKPGESPSKKSK